MTKVTILLVIMAGLHVDSAVVTHHTEATLEQCEEKAKILSGEDRLTAWCIEVPHD